MMRILPKSVWRNHVRAGGLVLAVLLLLPALVRVGVVRADETLPWRLQGDVGAAFYSDQSAIRGQQPRQQLLPYGYFDYGRLFARIDTFGVKTLPLGHGYLELAAQFSQDGYSTADSSLHGIAARRDSVPLGIGTFQETSVGGFFLNLFHDAGPSQGNLLQALYVAEIDFGRLVLYPQLGAEYRSRNYTQYYYGISPAEAAASGYAAYAPSASSDLQAAAMLEFPVSGNWYGNLYWRRKWLDTAATHSPLVERSTQDTAFISLSYRFM